MDLLLDTHIWLWSMGDETRLNARVAKELTSASNRLWLSPISVWELQLLHRKKRVTLDVPDAEVWVRRSLEHHQLNEATLTVEVALEVPKVNLPHGDPADYFLVASAKVFGLTLVTSDKNLIEFADVPILANR